MLEVCSSIVVFCCGMFWIVNCLFCWVWDVVSVCGGGGGVIDQVLVGDVLSLYCVDYCGFDVSDWCLLQLLIDYYGGGLVGFEILVVVFGDDFVILEIVVELFLLQQGLLMCIFCGCMVMDVVCSYLVEVV